ncbi:MAG: hypothetical protein KGN79_10580 [Acidobacteriota bacterium]|nr:hypothetical protein [Acidobacteriota bacterium]
MQAATTTRECDTSTPPLACLLSEASVHPSISTGKERDAESGNEYFIARYYGSSMGRFLSPDWSAKAEPVPYAKLGNPQSLNLYEYVGNNPLIYIDADGHCWPQWLCNFVQNTYLRFSNWHDGFGFQTDAGVENHPNKRSQRKKRENRAAEELGKGNNQPNPQEKLRELELQVTLPGPYKRVDTIGPAPIPKKQNLPVGMSA